MIETWEKRPISPPIATAAPGCAVFSPRALYAPLPMRVGEPTLVYVTSVIAITCSGAGIRASST